MNNVCKYFLVNYNISRCAPSPSMLTKMRRNSRRGRTKTCRGTRGASAVTSTTDHDHRTTTHAQKQTQRKNINTTSPKVKSLAHRKSTTLFRHHVGYELMYNTSPLAFQMPWKVRMLSTSPLLLYHLAKTLSLGLDSMERPSFWRKLSPPRWFPGRRKGPDQSERDRAYFSGAERTHFCKTQKIKCPQDAAGRA